MSKTKYCPKCYLTKSIKEFNRRSNVKDGLQGYCKSCSHETLKELRDSNSKYKEREQAYEKIRRQKIINGEMPHRRQANLIRANNYNTIKQIVKNPDNMKEKTFFKHFGCSKKVFIQRFEREFAKNPGMGWHNQGAWHMDHIKPLGSFTLDTEANRKLANHYTNLRPVWGTANLKKAAIYAVEQKI